MVKLLCGENIIMNEDKLIKYYNKFCEDKRLLSRHGQVEFRVTMGWLEKSEKLMAIKEAKRVLKKGGLLFISYLMADYAILIHGFRDGNITALRKDGFVDGDFNVISDRDGLYSYVSLDEVNELQKQSGLRRLAVVSQDGPSDYMRSVLNSMDAETFELFVQYQQQKSAKFEFLGASSHVLDILIKED